MPVSKNIKRAAQRKVIAAYLKVAAEAITLAKQVESVPKALVLGETHSEKLERIKQERKGLFGLVGGE